MRGDRVVVVVFVWVIVAVRHGAWRSLIESSSIGTATEPSLTRPSRLLAVLLALAAKGFSREKAYEVVQRSAMKSWRTGRPLSTLLWRDRDVRAALTKKEFDGLFDIGYYMKNIDGVIDRVFGRGRGKA